jgi:hypothetical protein
MNIKTKNNVNYIAGKLDLRKVEFPKNINNVIDFGGKDIFIYG